MRLNELEHLEQCTWNRFLIGKTGPVDSFLSKQRRNPGECIDNLIGDFPFLKT